MRRQANLFARKMRILEALEADATRPVLREKINLFPFHPNQIHKPRRPAPLRGAFRDRHERWARDAVDAGCRETSGADPPALKLRRDWYQDRRVAFVETAADGEV